jgi:putative transposase
VRAVAAALGQRVGLKRACEVLRLPRSPFYRVCQPRPEPQPRPTPANALSQAERAAVRQTLNSERFMDKAPRQVYASLLDEGRYLCSVSTMYRVLRLHEEVRERQDLRRHGVYQKPELLATAPNQVWSWDITLLRGPVKWSHFALYTVLDIFSRLVVGWLIAELQSAQLARQLIQETARRQAIVPGQLTLHSDNGTPMTGKPLTQLLEDLGVLRSHSRPYTSDDNPFSEAQFKTMKYRPDYPDRFADLGAARGWARPFFKWYNEEHYHSGLNLLTPASVHYGQAEAIRVRRQQVMSAAYAMFPARFAGGEPTVKGAPAAVYLNPPAETPSVP